MYCSIVVYVIKKVTTTFMYSFQEQVGFDLARQGDHEYN